MTMNIRPLGNKVVISLLEESDVTASGIILPDSAKDKPERGTVLAVGPGKMLDNGQLSVVEVAVGQIVLFKKYSPDEFKLDGKKMFVLDADDIIAVVE